MQKRSEQSSDPVDSYILVSEVSVYRTIHITYSTLSDTFGRVECINHLAVSDVDSDVGTTVEEYKVARLWIGYLGACRHLSCSCSWNALAFIRLHELLCQCRAVHY